MGDVQAETKKSLTASIALTVGILSGIVGILAGLKNLYHKEPIADIDGYWTSSVDDHVLMVNIMNSTGHPMLAQIMYPCARALQETRFGINTEISSWDGHKLWLIYKHESTGKSANLILKAVLTNDHLEGVVRDTTYLSSIPDSTEADDPSPTLVNVDLKRGRFACTQDDPATKLP